MSAFLNAIEPLSYIVIVVFLVLAGSKAKPGPAYLILFLLAIVGYFLKIPYFGTSTLVLVLLTTAFIVSYNLFLAEHGGGRNEG